MKSKRTCASRRLLWISVISSCSCLILLLTLEESVRFAVAESGHSQTPNERPQHSTLDKNWPFINHSANHAAEPDSRESGSQEGSEDIADLNNVIFIDKITSKNAGITEDRITDIPSTPSVIKLVEPPKKIHLDTLVEEKINAALQNTTKSKKQSTKKVSTDIEQPVAAIAPPSTPEPKHSNDPVLEILPKDGAPNTYNTDPGGVAEGDVLLVTPSPEDTLRVADSTVAPSQSVSKPHEMNLTSEEHPIPVFSEWAQKQLEEAEKKLEEEKVNSSTQKKSNAVSQKPQNGKLQTSMKTRAKNYASPDCGAKIIATNPEAQSTGAVLTSHRDEYLLNPCTSRIWFVVELCEAIQAESIELANFELFSSSPKDFVVSVGARFPTRDWSTVGQFTAKDERDVQSFQLHPHLFGKYVRVEVNSHYNSEHYCPISLFRVYGTSEMEAFETENQPQVPDGFDDDEDDPVLKKSDGDVKKNNNILKTAGEAVMNIVKKAAEALGKGGQNQTDAANTSHQFDTFTQHTCTSLAYDTVCFACSAKQSADLYTLLSCHMPALSSLLVRFRSNLYESQQCAKLLGFNLGVNKFERQPANNAQLFLERVVASRYLVAMCNLLGIEEKKVPMNTSCVSATTGQMLHLDNQTIDGSDGAKDQKSGPAKLVPSVGQTTMTDASPEAKEGDKQGGEITMPAVPPDANSLETQLPPTPVEMGSPGTNQVLITTTTPASSSVEVVTSPSVKVNGHTEAGDVKKSEPEAPTSEDVNIFNIPTDGSHEVESKPVTEQPTTAENPETTVEVPTTASSDETYSTSDDNKLLPPEPPLIDTPTESMTVTTPPTQPQIQQKNQPESVFLRLTNRIKALERNMSLSGQYLEELSKRYKRQVEELQLSFAKTLQTIEAQNRQSSEREQLLTEQNRLLRQDLDALLARIYNWKNILMYCGVFFLAQVLVMCLIARGCFGGRSQQVRAAKSMEKVIDRRNSVEGVITVPSAVKNSPITTQPRRRRPSEEALQIVGHYEELLIEDGDVDDDAAKLKRLEDKRKRRKNSNKTAKRAISEEIPVERIRKTGAKVALFRTDSAPANYENFSSSSSGVGGITGTGGEGSSGSFTARIDELPLLEDNDEFIIPGASDYSYNEFVPNSANVTSTPQQPNGETVSVSSLDSKQSSSRLGKARRLSSPAFLKNALNRNSSKTGKSTEPTGWEWYKLRKSSGGSSKVRKKSKSDSPPALNGGSGDSSANNNNNDKSCSVSLSSDVVVNLGHSGDGRLENGRHQSTPPPSPAESLMSSTQSSSLRRQKGGGSFRKIFRKMF